MLNATLKHARSAVAVAALMAIAFGAGLGLRDGMESAQAAPPKPGAQPTRPGMPRFGIAVCASKFNSNPANVKTKPPNQTASWECAIPVPKCPARSWVRSTKTQVASFQYSCTVTPYCPPGYYVHNVSHGPKGFYYRCQSNAGRRR